MKTERASSVELVALALTLGRLKPESLQPLYLMWGITALPEPESHFYQTPQALGLRDSLREALRRAL